MAGTQRAKRAPRLDFPVTQEHIDTAVPKDSGHCMVADALKAAYPNAEYVSVDLATIRFTDTQAGWRYIYLTPRAAQEALIAFDHGEKPQPFTVKGLTAAQMIVTGSARKARTQEAMDAAKARGETPKPRQVAGRVPAKLAPTKGNEVPTKVGGNAPPIGPSAGGSHTGRRRTGRTRGFGLRGFVE